MNDLLRCRQIMAAGLALLAIVLSGAMATSYAQERASGAWSRAAPLPEGRTEIAVATDGRLIYVIGGFAQDAGGRRAAAPRAMYVYDPAGDRWSWLGDIPEGVNHTGLAVSGARLYIVGGFREASFEPVAAVHAYDISRKTWTRAADLPTARGALAVAIVDGRVHAIGGTDANRRSLTTHEIYDPANDSWRSAAPVPTARNHHAAGVIDGRIHVVGGRDGGDYELTVHEVYDPPTGQWRTAPPLPTGRSGIAAAVLDGALYVFGGETFGRQQRTFDDAERFMAATGRWQILPPMPTARHGLGAAAVGSSIYVIGGGPRPGFSFSAANERLMPAPR